MIKHTIHFRNIWKIHRFFKGITRPATSLGEQGKQVASDLA